jgi:hypothetical protein
VEEERRYAKDTIIVREGDTDASLFLIKVPYRPND